MKRFVVLLLVLAAAAPASLAARPCDECKDLPRLFRELMEQEFLRDQFDSYVRQAYYPPTVDQMYASVEKRFNETFYSKKGGGTAGTPAAGGGAAYGTRSWRKECDLVEFLKGPDGKGLEDANGEPKVKPITPAELRQKECKPIADHVLDHEGHHQETCRKTHKDGTTASWQSAEFVAKDEVAAYQKGITSLRETISRLAFQCGWEGSVRVTKPDGTKVVPTKDQIDALKDNAKKAASTLKKRKKP